MYLCYLPTTIIIIIFFLLTFRFERLKCLIDLTLFPYASTQSFGIVIP